MAHTASVKWHPSGTWWLFQYAYSWWPRGDLNLLICVILWGFLGQVNSEPFSEVTCGHFLSPHLSFEFLSLFLRKWQYYNIFWSKCFNLVDVSTTRPLWLSFEPSNFIQNYTHSNTSRLSFPEQATLTTIYGLHQLFDDQSEILSNVSYFKFNLIKWSFSWQSHGFVE